MSAGLELTRAVDFSLARRDKESAIHFCRLARSGAVLTTVIYSSGLVAMRADHGGERAEVELWIGEQLRARGFTLVVP